MSLEEVKDSGATWTRTNVLYFAGRPVALWRKSESGAASTTYLTTDHLGTPVFALAANGTTLWHGGFEPFGRDWQAGTSSDSLKHGIPLRLPGQWLSAEWEGATLGMQVYYNVHRWYEPQTGRYTRIDPLSAAASGLPTLPEVISSQLLPSVLSIDVYTYARANPLTYLDLLGLQCSDACPDCPGGRWLFAGGKLDGMVGKYFSFGGSGAAYKFRCTSSRRSCDVYTQCAKALGIGASGGATFSFGFAHNAKCAEDLEGITLGPDVDAGRGWYGSVGFQAGPRGGSPYSGGIEVGVGFGASGAAAVCTSTVLGCN